MTAGWIRRGGVVGGTIVEPNSSETGSVKIFSTHPWHITTFLEPLTPPPQVFQNLYKESKPWYWGKPNKPMSRSELSSTLAGLNYSYGWKIQNCSTCKGFPFIILRRLSFRSSQESAFQVFVQHMKGSVSKAEVFTSMLVSQVEMWHWYLPAYFL